MASNKVCSVDDCGNTLLAKGLCQMHYARMSRHGSVEPTRIPPGGTLKFINSLFEINENNCVIWPFAKSKNGYGQFRLEGKTATVSRYVCEIKHGERSRDIHAAHSCGQGHLGCVNPNHIFWKTAKENSDDKNLHGTILLGEKCFGAKLSKLDVLEIRVSGLPNKELCKIYGVSRSQINNIKSLKSWRWL